MLTCHSKHARPPTCEPVQVLTTLPELGAIHALSFLQRIGITAENHAAMGAFNHLFDAIKRDDLRAKLGEFLPFGLIPQIDIEN